MAFKLAQTFYIDKTSVRDAEHVTVTSIDLFFKAKPLASANRSGILEPGATVTILETREDDIPNAKRIVETGFSRMDYKSIIGSNDASILTKFNFSRPVILSTNKSYAVAVSFDGDEDFALWTCKEGETIVGTNTTSSGATARNVGKFYEFSSVINSDYYSSLQEQWKPLNNTDLKFAVNVGVYSANVSSTDINTTYVLPCDPVEYVLYDRYHYETANRANVSVGDILFQETPVIYGPISVSNTSTTITASGGVNFSLLVSATENIEPGPASTDPIVRQKSYIVLRNGASQAANVNVMEVVSVVSNTQIVVNKLPTFTNNVATFSVTAAARLSHHTIHYYTGRWWNSTTNVMADYKFRKVDMLRLSDTNANSTVRFVNNMVRSITVSSGGTSYSNADYITVSPMTNANTANVNHPNYITSYANATANIVTNGSGTITGIGITNAGFGITANAQLTITTSTGSAANLQPIIGSLLRSEKSGAFFGNTVVTNVEVHRSFPHMQILSNQHHNYRLFQHYPYYITPGTEHILRASTPAAKKEVDTFTNVSAVDFQTNDGRTYVIASRSNEAVQSSNVQISVSNGAVVNTSVKSSSILEVSIQSNNAYSLPMVVSDDVYNYKNIINNDATGESSGNGKALARHISKKVVFAENRSAEDVLVYLDAYRPAGTNIKVYARILSKNDREAFDDKDWTELELKSNNDSAVSSLTDESDALEFTYGLPTSPATVSVLTGDAAVSNNVANVVGVGTTWSSDLQANDVIKIYSPLFPQNYLVSVVRSVSNNTFITIDDVILDPNVLGSMKVALVGRPGVSGRPFSAWSNRPNSFVSRYYDSQMSKQDTYNSFAIKIVLLSSSTAIVPKINNIRAVGVSA